MPLQPIPSSGHLPSSPLLSRTSCFPSRCSRSRRRRALALVVLPLLVLPTVVVAAAVGAAPADVAHVAGTNPAEHVVVDSVDDAANTAKTAANAAVAAGVAAPADPAATPAAAAAAGSGSGTKVKYDAGTKQVPFDGKDGRPHEGPFVEIENSRKASNADTGDEPVQKTSVYIDGKKVPESNDGVMDDKNRVAPKQGTTGMSGGVSEKNKQRKAKEGQTGERVENMPETPKEVPALPHHEEEKIFGQDGGKDAKDDKAKDGASNDAAKFGKPSDLSDKFHEKTMPMPGSAKKDHLDLPTSSSDKSRMPARPDGEDEAPATLIQPLHSFLLSLTMILFSEVGDKTFLVAALMAMKHDRIVVFSAAFSALFAMTVLSAVLGHAVPVLVPKRLTNFLAAGLFLVFGARMLREGLGMGKDEGVAAEMQEVELELAEKELQARENGRRHSRAGGGVLSPDTLEMGMGAGAAGTGGRQPRSQSRFSTPNRSASSSLSPPPGDREGVVAKVRGFGTGLSNLASLLLSPAWVQTFVMTFLGEWGDRSQIATLAMAAGQDYWWVTLGAVTGHACCTSVAVIGGRAIAGRVSLRVVTIGGAVSFLLFGVIYLVEAFYA
ncbi:upf0016 domain protein [Niveomyces insectorum RCEF 264]|uniref:Upf0016 domain protein n=1 Tax=Niveomyces insectorum RCEF 264 TaxID=1081102 RepID=A0A167LXU9_9HYPO|nr:upf0016 domain protein [Niveomyces insectorum RCEF 264]